MCVNLYRELEKKVRSIFFSRKLMWFSDVGYRAAHCEVTVMEVLLKLHLHVSLFTYSFIKFIHLTHSFIFHTFSLPLRFIIHFVYSFIEFMYLLHSHLFIHSFILHFTVSFFAHVFYSFIYLSHLSLITHLLLHTFIHSTPLCFIIHLSIYSLISVIYLY